ncbi:MAG: restriction endonuclease subunit S [Thiobacillus sp.]|nr:restriction endonuclease subunit S [Thiobacillus sp.]
MTSFKPLRELVTFRGGGTPSKQVAEYWNGGIPWASVKDFTSTSLSETQDFISQEGLRNSSANLIPKGHVIIPTRMSLGKAAINTVDLAINQDLRALVPKVSLDARFLLHAVLSLKEEIVKKGSGATVKGITQEELYKLEIAFPPLDDQIRIAHLLGKVEGLIAQRKQHLQQLDDLLKSVFLEMFGDPVRNEKGWKPTTIGDSVEIQSGQVDPRELPYSELPHVGGANIESASGNLVELKQAKYENLISGKYLFDSTYILYSKIRPYLNKVSKPDFQGVCSADIYPIKPINGLLNRDFLRMLLMSKAFLNYTANNSDRANIPKINRKALVVFGFNRPSIELQNQFTVIVNKVEAIKSRYQQSLTDLETLYGALSQQAFKGELDLSRVASATKSTEDAETER